MYTNCTGQNAKQIILGNGYTVQEDAWEDNIHAVLETWMVL
jgi:hypothetical protein